MRKNPFKNIAKDKSPKSDWHFITPDEFKALLNVVDDLRVRTLYAVMYGCGLRSGEAVNLTWDNLNLTEKQLALTNRAGTKTIPAFSLKDHESRTLPMPKFVCDLLAPLKEQASAKNPFVFLTDERLEQVQQRWQMYQRDGKAQQWTNDLMINNLLRNFKVHCRQAGVVTHLKLYVHCLRKAYGTNLANQSVPFQTLKKLMGHSSIETTMKYYLKSSTENEIKASQMLDKLMA